MRGRIRTVDQLRIACCSPRDCNQILNVRTGPRSCSPLRQTKYRDRFDGVTELSSLTSRPLLRSSSTSSFLVSATPWPSIAAAINTAESANLTTGLPTSEGSSPFPAAHRSQAGSNSSESKGNWQVRAGVCRTGKLPAIDGAATTIKCSEARRSKYKSPNQASHTSKLRRLGWIEAR